MVKIPFQKRGTTNLKIFVVSKVKGKSEKMKVKKASVAKHSRFYLSAFIFYL